MKVKCESEEIELDGDGEDLVESICVSCTRCQHAVEVFGRSDRSIRRGLVMLREECPNGEQNFYVCDGSMTHD